MSKRIKVRPGKTQSKVGFVVGLFFCLIGLVLVVPTFGAFGLLWTGVAIWITYSHYRNGFTDKPISNQVIEIEENGDDVIVTKNRFGNMQISQDEINDDAENIEIRLRKLQSLYQQELITHDEYEKKRQEILNDL